MAAHHQILAAAQRLCAGRSPAEFTPDELVRALPELNPQTVRTHVTSRCCVNAAPHHQSRLQYFRRTGRGRYLLLPAHQRPVARRRAAPARRNAEAPDGRDTVHAIVTRDGSAYVVECHEIAVVTQGRTLDQALANLVEAVGLHLDGEDLAVLGFGAVTRIQVSYELAARINAA